jgi:hypothetical protein
LSVVWYRAGFVPDAVTRPPGDIPEFRSVEPERIEVVTHLPVVADGCNVGASDPIRQTDPVGGKADKLSPTRVKVNEEYPDWLSLGSAVSECTRFTPGLSAGILSLNQDSTAESVDSHETGSMTPSAV